MIHSLLIGSHAAETHGIELGRIPKDVDVFSNHDLWRNLENADVFWDDRLHAYLDKVGEGMRIATLDELYTIKVSHSYWELKNGSWWKHIKDQRLLKEAGATLIDEFHDILYKIWEDRYGKKRVNLDMSAATFFKDAVKRIYDHDSIHYSVAYGDTPMYEAVLKDGSDVLVDSKKLWQMSDEDRDKLFLEEIYATALERIIIPSEYRASPRAAYAWALTRTITSLTKGKSAKYLSTNIERFFRMPDDYVQRHKDKKHLLIELKEGESTA